MGWDIRDKPYRTKTFHKGKISQDKHYTKDRSGKISLFSSSVGNEYGEVETAFQNEDTGVKKHLFTWRLTQKTSPQ